MKPGVKRNRIGIDCVEIDYDIAPKDPISILSGSVELQLGAFSIVNVRL